MTDKSFYVRFPVEGAGAYANVTSGTKITVPDDLDYAEAEAFIIEAVTEHLRKWGAYKILESLNIREVIEGRNGKKLWPIRLEGCGRFHWIMKNCLPGELDAIVAENERMWAEETTATPKRSRLFETQWEATKKALCEGADFIYPENADKPAPEGSIIISLMDVDEDNDQPGR